MNWTPEREAEYQRWREDLENAPVLNLSVDEALRRCGFVGADGSWSSLYEQLTKKAARSRARGRRR